MAKNTRKATEAEAAKPELDIEALVNIATDMNQSLGLDPAIDTELEAEALLDAIKNESAVIGVNPKTNAVEKRVIDEDKKNLNEETWAFLEQNEFLGHIKDELAKAEAAAAAPSGNRPQPGVNPFPKRYTRQQALIDTLKEGTTDVAKIVANADDLVVKNGGKSNTEGVKTDFDWFVTVAVGVGIAKLKDGKFTLNK